MTPSAEGMIRKYVAAWNEKELDAYRAGFSACWAEDGTYTDPNYALKGLDALADLAYTSLEREPARIFHVVTLPDHHHNCGRYTWSIELPGVTKEGYDYFEFSDDYKITKLVSFF